MTDRATYIYVGILAGWLGFALMRMLTEPLMAAIAGLFLGVGLIHGLRQTVAVRGLVAVLEPVAVTLPILVLWHLAVSVAPQLTGGLGRWNAVELLVFLVGYVAFLAASMGVFRLSPYPLGYRAVPVGAMVLAVCLWALITGNPVLAVIAVAGQITWALRIGSSNWFDHVLHVLLVPVVAVELITRLL